MTGNGHSFIMDTFILNYPFRLKETSAEPAKEATPDNANKAEEENGGEDEDDDVDIDNI